jgi:hypothetical protein
MGAPPPSGSYIAVFASDNQVDEVPVEERDNVDDRQEPRLAPSTSSRGANMPKASCGSVASCVLTRAESSGTAIALLWPLIMSRKAALLAALLFCSACRGAELRGSSRGVVVACTPG